MKQKLEHMTSSELRALIAELRPLEVCDLVEREHPYWVRGKCSNPCRNNCGAPKPKQGQLTASYATGAWRTRCARGCIIGDGCLPGFLPSASRASPYWARKCCS